VSVSGKIWNGKCCPGKVVGNQGEMIGKDPSNH
jgi:hypothetical protein